MSHDVIVTEHYPNAFVVACVEGCYLGRSANQDTAEAAERRAALHRQTTAHSRYDGARQ